jgi:hypothetical protein
MARPYDAEHVRYVDHGVQVVAVWGDGDPERWEDIRDGRVEVIGEVTRVFAYEGAGWWGYTLRVGSDHCPLEGASKADALHNLKAAVVDYFDR